MTPKFSLIIGTAVAALVFAAPAAAVFPTVDGGDSGYAERAAGSVATVAPDFWNYDANGQKVADTSPGVAPEDVASLYAGASGASESSTMAVTTSSASRDVPRPGTGAALGVALLLGLLLVRRRQIRQFAH
jgi:MYXO-CTERM domain-containing protein